MGLPTYGMTYNKDQYSYSLIGDLKVIVKAMNNKEKSDNKPAPTAKPAKPNNKVNTNGGDF